MVSDRFRLRYSLTPEHYQSFVGLVRKRMAKQINRKKLFAIAAIVGAIIGVLLIIMGKSSSLSHRDVAAGLAGAVFMLVAMRVATFLICGKNLARNSSLFASQIGQYSLAAYEGGGIQITGNHVSSSYEWSAFMELTQEAGLFVLWRDRGSGLLIPVSTFSNDDEREEFMAFVEERIEANRQVD